MGPYNSNPERSLAINDRIWELRTLHNKSLAAIGKEVGIAHSAVSKRLKKMAIEYAKAHLDKLDYYKTLQIKDLERVAQEAWEAWLLSKEPKTIRKVKEVIPMGMVSPVQIEEFEYLPPEGNVKFLVEYRAALAEIREILGLNAAWEVNFTYKDRSEKEAAIDEFMAALAPPASAGTTTTIN